MSKTTGNKRKLSLIALALVACLAVAGVSAYFTDADTATNQFTIGKVSLDLQEPSFKEPEAIELTPEEEIEKDPQVKNTGINDEFVFIEVEVPCANVQTANEDGTYNAAAKTELFSWDVNPGWVQVEVEETDAKNTYVYGWVGYTTSTDANGETVYINNTNMQPLVKDDLTDALFNWVRFANVTENANLEGASLEVVVNAYGIQTTNLNDNDADIDGDNADGVTAPAAVWEVIEIQLPSTAQAAEDPSTDKIS